MASAIEKAVHGTKDPLSGLSKPERLEYHRKKISYIQRHEGSDGVGAYKIRFPEADIVRHFGEIKTYIPKPKGYDAYLVKLAKLWLLDSNERNGTNTAAVKALNAYLGTSFNPANHFSALLSDGRLEKIKAVFTERGVPLDTSVPTSMSRIRSAAKAAAGHRSADRSFGGIGVVAGDILAINGQTFAIEKNGIRDCIRVPIAGKRHRIYLDDMEWTFGLLGHRDFDPLDTTLRSIGELAYPDETAPTPRNVGPEISEPAYSPNPFGQRIAALRGPQELPPLEWPDGVDPLSLPDE